MISNPIVRDLLDKIQEKGNLSALDRNIQELNSISDDEEIAMAKITSIILRDTALTSHILSAANEGGYKSSAKVKTVSAALVRLGMARVKALTLGMSVFKLSKNNMKSRDTYRLFICAYFSGTMSKILAGKARHEIPEEVFIAGMLSQLPRVLIANTFPDRHREIEQLTATNKYSLEDAFEKTFKVTYSSISNGIAELWNLPALAPDTFGPEKKEKSLTADLVCEASHISDMLFGNAPGGDEALFETEQRIRKLLGNETFSIEEFTESISEEDPDVKRIFNLSSKDVEMMFKIVEWGKVSASQVSAELTYGSDLDETTNVVEEDPQVMVGNFLTEMMLCLRKHININEVLMLAQEAIYRLLKPTCIFTSFLDGSRERLRGRLYVGLDTNINAGDFSVPIIENGCRISRCLDSRESLCTPVDNGDLGSNTILDQLHLRYAIIAPIVVSGEVIGAYFVGSDSDECFSDQEQVWVEAFVSHVGSGFKKVKESTHSRPAAGSTTNHLDFPENELPS